MIPMGVLGGTWIPSLSNKNAASGLLAGNTCTQHSSVPLHVCVCVGFEELVVFVGEPDLYAAATVRSAPKQNKLESTFMAVGGL